jgi:Ca2+-binding RTX toxin-like protein
VPAVQSVIEKTGTLLGESSLLRAYAASVSKEWRGKAAPPSEGGTDEKVILIVATVAVAVLALGSVAQAALTTGGPGDDEIVGTDHSDTILARRGADRLFGLGSTDVINGGKGNDLVGGGGGEDELIGAAGDDTIYTAPAPRATSGATRSRAARAPTRSTSRARTTPRTT